MNTTTTNSIQYAIDVLEKQIKELKNGAVVGGYELAVKISDLRMAINGLKEVLKETK